jgi:GT2 family glycosyltransferase
MKLSIVLVSYNTKKLLDDCLRSIFLSYRDCQVIVVDNASSDGSVEMVKSKYPQVNLIKNKKNLGFGKANNLGAQKAAGEIIFFLNSDTIVPSSSLRKLVSFFKDHLQAGIVSPKVVLKNGQAQPYSFGDDPTILSLIKEKLIKNQSQARTKKVDWVTGAALAIRRNLFKKLAGFDEKIFMYFEDNDLCFRARQLGWQVWLNPQSEIIHIGGASKKDSKEQKDIYFKSQDYFFKKHYGLIGWLFLKLIRLPYRLIKK